MKSINAKLNEPMKDDASLIKWKWNLDMNVTVSNVKKSKIFQRIYMLFILILAIVFAFTLSYLKKEVEALHAKIDCINDNFLKLISKHDKLNRSLNRGCLHHQSIHLSNHHASTDSIESAIRKFSDLSIVYRNRHASDISPLTSNPDQTDPLDAYKVNTSAISNFTTSYMRFQNDLNVDSKRKQNFLRSRRAISTFETQNLTVTRNQTVDNDIILKEPRVRRLRRVVEGRGKNQRQNRRRSKRSRVRLGPLMATFIGAIPEQHIKDTVYIGPWIKHNKNNNQYDFTKFHLVEDKMSIEVTINGLYMISVQIFYFGEPTNYSYWILLHPEGASITQKLSKCAAASSSMVAEVSCYTSIVTYLQRGDRLRVQQQEKNRLINMREGYSHIQLVLLSDNKRKRRSAELQVLT